MQLVWPAREHLPSYIAALESGWSADNVRGAAAAAEELLRLPGFRRWMWDGEFCGVIGLRWQRGTEALPPHCLGHIGYAVVPAKRNRGHARRALAETLPLARAEGLRWIELTTDTDNAASRRTIEANGGVLVEHFTKPAAFGGGAGVRYRIHLA